MSFWILLQVVMDFVLAAGVVGMWIRLKRPPQDDPRFSRGLQLLQTKISVLEDLSDRTETQVNQVTSLMESKIKEIQSLIIESDKKIQIIDASMMKSLDVAKIFQERIPHQEIVERQNTIKYVKAARMAHQGMSVYEIANQVDLSQGEIEFIVKINRNQLQFSEENLPEWARAGGEMNIYSTAQAMNQDKAQISPQPLEKKEDQVSLSALGDRFRQAMPDESTVATHAQPSPQPAPQMQMQMQQTAPIPVPQVPVYAQNSKGQEVQIRKVVFPKVDSNNFG